MRSNDGARGTVFYPLMLTLRSDPRIHPGVDFLHGFAPIMAPLLSEGCRQTSNGTVRVTPSEPDNLRGVSEAASGRGRNRRYVYVVIELRRSH
jgi:hypothetical protein